MKRHSKRVRKPFPLLYHISFNDRLEGIWTPRVPDGVYDIETDTASLRGEPLTPRISVAPTLGGCFQGVYENVKHLFDRHPELTFQIYQAMFRGTERIVTFDQLTKHKLVYDAHVTGEHAILDRIEMRHIGRVTVGKPRRMLNYQSYGDDKEQGQVSLPDMDGLLQIQVKEDRGYREGKDSTVTHNGQIYYVDDLLAMAAPLPVTYLDVVTLKWILTLPDKPDYNRVLSADVNHPLIVVNDPDHGNVIVDGYHRFAKLVAMGVDNVPCKVIRGTLPKPTMESRWMTW